MTASVSVIKNFLWTHLNLKGQLFWIKFILSRSCKVYL